MKTDAVNDDGFRLFDPVKNDPLDRNSASRAAACSHLIITGSRGSGKSTLLRGLLSLPYFSSTQFQAMRPFPGFTTHAFPHDRVELKDNRTGKSTRIGFYDPGLTTDSCTPGNQMRPDRNGFLGTGLSSIQHAIASPSPFAVIDELGYLESSCPEFCDAVFRLFDRKHVIAVCRSQSTPFLDALRSRDDVFVYDLDRPVLPVGCVIMASGLGKRFGSNKLMADFHGEPLIARILSASDSRFFAGKIVVTRSQEVESFCKEQEIPVLFHTMPDRNDTVRLGLSCLMNAFPDLSGCMFALGDQPLLTRETLDAMVLSFSWQSHFSSTQNNSIRTILRLASFSDDGSMIPGNPILFGNVYFHDLLTLPKGRGGNVLLQKYPDHILYFPAKSPFELVDADTPEELERLKKAELVP